MTNANLIPLLLLLLIGVAVALGTVIIVLAARWRRQWMPPGLPKAGHRSIDVGLVPALKIHHLPRPNCWVAVRAHRLGVVQSALRLINPHPCTWTQGLSGSDRLFIAPPVKGWILMAGSGLPDPTDDVDVCFRFLVHLSRRFGEVQYFMANPILGHHAWVRVKAGRVLRAYAWAGQTLWNQGRQTAVESGLGMACFPYFEAPSGPVFGPPDSVWSNTEKVPLLAARWSLDPATLDERRLGHAWGVAGEVPRLY